MMLKIVYGPPPDDGERIEVDYLEVESGIREEEPEIIYLSALPHISRKSVDSQEF